CPCAKGKRTDPYPHTPATTPHHAKLRQIAHQESAPATTAPPHPARQSKTSPAKFPPRATRRQSSPATRHSSPPKAARQSPSQTHHPPRGSDAPAKTNQCPPRAASARKAAPSSAAADRTAPDSAQNAPSPTGKSAS